MGSCLSICVKFLQSTIFCEYQITGENEMTEKAGPMSGKLCMVTGATSGIGAATAHALAEQGADVVIVGRNEKKCIDRTQKIMKTANNTSVDYFVADLSLQKDIYRLADQFKRKHRVLDVLVNNAGGKFVEQQMTAEGFELSFALNHLGYFLLTNLLLPELKASKQGRIVNVASGSHSGCSKINFDDLQSRDGYVGKAAYAQSKLANLLFTYELARRLEGTGVTVNALEPGGVISGFCRNNGWVSWGKHVVAHILKGNLVGPEEGARTSVYLASSPDVAAVSGKYFSGMKAVQSSGASYDVEGAKRLWRVSLEMTGLKEMTVEGAP
jgi:NAD(P)-dependent dehydrogenase (short-subunit alcohol dehydrogenase family)